ncbi:ATP-binding cassette domain-containing protein [Thiomicrorhabdus sp. zzn3]|uniref:ABC transporter ATP-binding protein n=1 Tax=Thiomicrorhabdus sp. zzn3 TaxID=3039775 RepID=UPI00243702AE|nr:ATP-binding cassette domain-containing protein [Thiomicrorhabdus sp. zzn3]MDG6777423.1 ATP-binding cassette domain-containing protein [Thiomicrorhabdus sp. zzn3]
MSSDKLIEIQNLSFSRGSRKIFDQLDLVIPKGKVTAIMGPSGTGKTTLLKLIAGQIKPDSGRILVEGEDVHKLKRSRLYALRKKMGMLFQSGALLTDLSVFDNVAFPLREHTKLPESLIYPLVLMKLQAVGLKGARDLMPSELSGGMSRRVALARAISLDPEMIFYDEPFVGQDPITMGVLVELIRKLNDSLGISSVVVSHDVHEVLSIADHVCVLSEGRIIVQGSKDEVLNSGSEYAQQFLQGLPDGPVPFHYSSEGYLEALRPKGKK